MWNSALVGFTKEETSASHEQNKLVWNKVIIFFIHISANYITVTCYMIFICVISLIGKGKLYIWSIIFGKIQLILWFKKAQEEEQKDIHSNPHISEKKSSINSKQLGKW